MIYAQQVVLILHEDLAQNIELLSVILIFVPLIKGSLVLLMNSQNVYLEI